VNDPLIELLGLVDYPELFIMPAAAGSASSDIKKFENAQPDLFRILNFIKENAQKPVVEALKDVNAAKWE